MYICFWKGMLTNGKEICKNYYCDTEKTAKVVEKGLSKHSIYTVDSRVYWCDNDDDIQYFECEKPLPIEYKAKNLSKEKALVRLNRIDNEIFDYYKELVYSNKLMKKTGLYGGLLQERYDDIKNAIWFYKSYKSHMQRCAR